MTGEMAQFVPADLSEAQAGAILEGLAQVFLNSPGLPEEDPELPKLDALYRTLIEQIPAVVFMAYLDRGVGEAYVSPQIEAMLGFTRDEWLEDPVRWYDRIHPDDKNRWCTEAAGMFLSGQPLRSVYRVVARDGRVVSFHCDAKMVRRADGRPWFIHGVGFDITDLKRAEEALHDERNFAAAVLDTVGALVVVTDPSGLIIRFNRACERTTGFTLADVAGGRIRELLVAPEDVPRFQEMFEQLQAGRIPAPAEISWKTRAGERRDIEWSGTVLTGVRGDVEYIILSGIDVTESKRLERVILDVSGREQRRIGHDLHDGLGQHLTGVAFMSKVLEQKLREKARDEAGDAARIVGLVNEAINKTRELSRGLSPVLSDERGLMSALERLAVEVEDLFKVPCEFDCVEPVLIRESGLATNVYRIAQEAVNNSVRHGRASRIAIRLQPVAEGCRLSVTDDGIGLDQTKPAKGMGLLIMSYRAKVINGVLEIRARPEMGTSVICTFPVERATKKEGS